MSITAQVDQSKPERIAEDAFLNVNFDTTTSWGSLAGSIPRIIESNGVVINLLMLQNSVTFDQNRALRAMLNLYSEFTVRKISVEWVPMYPDRFAPTAFSNLGLAGINLATKENINLLFQFFGKSSEVWMLPDHDDTIVADNDQGNFYLARSQGTAVHALTTESTMLNFSPHIQDIVMTQSGPTAAGGNQSNLYAPIGSISLTDTGAGAGSIKIGTVSKPMGWLPSRVYTSDYTAALSGLDFNVYQTLFGYKYYFYTPFNSTPTDYGARINVGLFRYNFQLAFRKPEMRPWLIPQSDFIETEVSYKKRKLLAELTGEQMLAHGVKPQFTQATQYQADQLRAQGKTPVPLGPRDQISEEELDTKLAKAIAEKEKQQATEPKSTPVTAEGPKQSVQSTPLSRLSQALPGRRG